MAIIVFLYSLQFGGIGEIDQIGIEEYTIDGYYYSGEAELIIMNFIYLEGMYENRFVESKTSYVSVEDTLQGNLSVKFDLGVMKIGVGYSKTYTNPVVSYNRKMSTRSIDSDRFYIEVSNGNTNN